MKKLFGHLSVMILLVIFVLSGCKKYPEGPSFSLRTKKARITNTWTLEKYLFDDSLATSWYTNTYSSTIYTINSDYTMTTETQSAVNNTVHKGKWSFQSQHNVLEFQESELVQNGTSYFSSDKHEFIIQELRYKVFAIKEKIAGHTSTYYFKPK
ncbi:MAG: hypothetical protein RJA07_1268 [Bacteroidota bacterium]|jgi:hypothetical protein